MRSKFSLPILAVLASTGCAGTMRGPDTCAEIHLDATYALARWAGWSPAEARAIAAADYWTDQHGATTSVATEWRLLGGIVNPVTLPWILCCGVGDVVVGGDTPRRAFGKRAAESTAWAVPALGHRLHFPATGNRSPVAPAFFVNPDSGEIEYGNAEARRVLERAFVDLQAHDEDFEGTLALLGIGLHTLQDSFKHCGYTAAQGHIGARPDPDEPCCDLETTMVGAVVTLSSLRYARRLWSGSSSTPPAGWKGALRQGFIHEGDVDFTRDQFPGEFTTRDALVLRWQSEKGEQAFERALERVREALK